MRIQLFSGKVCFHFKVNVYFLEFYDLQAKIHPQYLVKPKEILMFPARRTKYMNFYDFYDFSGKQEKQEKVGNHRKSCKRKIELWKSSTTL